MASCNGLLPPALLHGFLFLCRCPFTLKEGEKHCCSHLQELPLRCVTNKDAAIFLPPYSLGVHLDVLQKHAILMTKISPSNQNHPQAVRYLPPPLPLLQEALSSSSPQPLAAALYPLFWLPLHVSCSQGGKKPFNALELLLFVMNMLHSLLSSTRFLRLFYSTLSTGIIKTKPHSIFKNSSFSRASPNTLTPPPFFLFCQKPWSEAQEIHLLCCSGRGEGGRRPCIHAWHVALDPVPRKKPRVSDSTRKNSLPSLCSKPGHRGSSTYPISEPSSTSIPSPVTPRLDAPI